IGIAGAVLLTLAGGLAATSYEARDASAERDAARSRPPAAHSNRRQSPREWRCVREPEHHSRGAATQAERTTVHHGSPDRVREGSRPGCAGLRTPGPYRQGTIDRLFSGRPASHNGIVRRHGPYLGCFHWPADAHIARARWPGTGGDLLS